MRWILILILAVTSSAHASCEHFSSTKKDFVQVAEFFKNYTGTSITAGQLAVGTYFTSLATQYGSIATQVSRHALNRPLEYQTLLFETVEAYSKKESTAKAIAHLAFTGLRTSTGLLVVSDFVFHLMKPPKAGSSAKRSEEAIDALIANPSLLFYLSKESACEYLHDSPDVAQAFENLKNEIEEKKRLLKLMETELYGSPEEQKFWMDAIKDVGVQMIQFEI